MTVRTTLAVLGVASVGAAFALLAGGSEYVPISVPYAGIAPVLLVAIGVAWFHLLDSVTVDRERWEPTEVGSSYHVPTPGDELADLSDREVRARLHRHVVQALVDHHDVTPEEARERVASEAWTDDDVAAAYVAGSFRPSIPARIVGHVGDEDPETRARRRTLAALQEVRGR